MQVTLEEMLRTRWRATRLCFLLVLIALSWHVAGEGVTASRNDTELHVKQLQASRQTFVAIM